MATFKHNTKSGPGRVHYSGQIGRDENKPFHEMEGGKILRKILSCELTVRHGVAPKMAPTKRMIRRARASS